MNSLREEFKISVGGQKPTVLEDQELMEIKEQRSYKWYVGEGNNSGVVKAVIRGRTWWNITKKDKINEWEFVWTSWKQGKILSTMKRIDSVDGSTSERVFMYNKMEGNQHIADKKGIFLSLSRYYKENKENPLDNIPLTFLIK